MMNRRFFLKTILKLGVFSFFPTKILALEEIKDCEPTTIDIQGPFYIPDAPNIYNLSPPEINSDFLIITGTVYANDCSTPIPGAIVDVWHANKGELDDSSNTYINSNYEDEFYRSKMISDTNGNYAFQTIFPGKYLNGNYYRPSHIHYKSSYLNSDELTTQIYFDGDTSITTDPWASTPAATNRIITLNLDNNNNLNGVFDIILDIDPDEINTQSIEENKTIKSIWPNPINEHTYIYLENKNENIILEICDINGRTLSRKNSHKNKIHLYSLLTRRMKSGIYILKTIKENGVINAKRFVF